jgi:hypothetical protein
VSLRRQETIEEMGAYLARVAVLFVFGRMILSG